MSNEFGWKKKTMHEAMNLSPEAKEFMRSCETDIQPETCNYPDCRCPFDMGPDHQCLKGLPVIRK